MYGYLLKIYQMIDDVESRLTERIVKLEENKMTTGFQGHKVITTQPNVTFERWCNCKDGFCAGKAIEKELG